MASEREQLESAIQALEAQRALLGGAVVEPLLALARAKLAALEQVRESAQTRKQVSIVFLDVVGSTALSRHLDPEELHAVIDGALARCTRVVEAHGGKVLQYAGDSLLAAFGAEQAREDDAERAVRCGLRLLDEGKALRAKVSAEHGHEGCDVRVGIHSGPVLLGGGVDDEGTIRGLTVNIAACMEQTAPPGGLRISHDTWLLARGLFDVDPQPPLAVKGHDEPLSTYLVRRARPRTFQAPSRGIEGVVPAMVGRAAELAQLVELLDARAGEQRLRIATIVGEPGVGKSRLLHEFEAVLHERAAVRLLRARAHPPARLQPYALLRDLLAARFQIADGDQAEAAKAKIEAGLLPFLRAPAPVHRIGQLVGLDYSASPHVHGLEPQLVRRLGFAALRDCLRAMAADGAALVVLLEDLQWADDGSLDFIAELERDAADLAIVVVATARPELLERRPDWTDAFSGHRRLPLSALGASQAHALAGALLARVTDGAESLRELLVERSEGNPFYMEELLRMLLDDGVVRADGARWHVLPDKLRAARVPATLVEVLQARLDTLPVGERHGLEQASIVGYVFWDAALAALDARAPSAIPALLRKAFIRRHAGSAFEGTAEASFHHHLLHQVTYDTVLRPARRTGHAAAARWLAERVGDRSSEYLAVTAEHYDRAGEHANALDYFERAALNARERFANAAALDYTGRALRSPALLDARRRARLLELRCRVADLAALRDMQGAAIDELQQIAERLDDDSLRADALGAKALLASRRGDETTALALARQTLAVATRARNVMAATLALGQIGFSLFSRGDAEGARRHAQDGLERVRAALRAAPTPELQSRELQLLVTLGQAENGSGHLHAADAILNEALERATTLGNRRLQALASLQLGINAGDAAHPERALPHLEAALAVAREIGAAAAVARSLYESARAQLEFEELQRCAEHLGAAEIDAQRSGMRDTLARCLLMRGRLAEKRADAHAARAAYQRALELFEALEDAPFACLTRGLIASVELDCGRPAQASELVEGVAAELARGLAVSWLERRAEPFWLCHRVWAACGDARADQALETAHAELQAQALRCGSDTMQRSLLENVQMHRQIVSAWRARRSR